MKFLIQHKGFIFAWVFWFTTASLMMVGASALAVFVKRPAPPAPMVAHDGTVLPPGVRPKTLNELVEEQASTPANLTRVQWQELRELLKVLPYASQNVSTIHVYANQRREALLANGDFIFTRYNQIPQQTKDDWQALKDFQNAQDPDATQKFANLQERFISATLTTGEVGFVLDNAIRYEQARANIAASTALIDRIVPVLKENGLYAEGAAGSVKYQDPKPTLREYISQVASFALPGLNIPPPPLPTTRYTAKELLQQLSQAPLSEGKTSAARAALFNTADNSRPAPERNPNVPLSVSEELHRLDSKFEAYAKQILTYQKAFASEQQKERPNLVATATDMIPALRQDLKSHPICWRDLDLLERSLTILNLDPKEQLIPEYRSLCFALLREFYGQMDAVSAIERTAEGVRAQGRQAEAAKLDEQIQAGRSVARELLDTGKRFADAADKPDRRYISSAVGLFYKELSYAEGALGRVSPRIDFAKEWQRIQIYLKP